MLAGGGQRARYGGCVDRRAAIVHTDDERHARQLDAAHHATIVDLNVDPDAARPHRSDALVYPGVPARAGPRPGARSCKLVIANKHQLSILTASVVLARSARKFWAFLRLCFWFKNPGANLRPPLAITYATSGTAAPGPCIWRVPRVLTRRAPAAVRETATPPHGRAAAARACRRALRHTVMRHLASRCIETQKREALYTIRCKFSIGALYLDASATGCEGWALHLDAASLSRHETRRSKCARAPSGYTTRARAKRLPRARVPSGYHGHACQAATTRSRAKVAAGPRARAPSGYHAPLTERLSAQGAKHNKIRIRSHSII